ncbi:MAG: M14 family metallocarboxypeptidase [Pseudomonadota bacterium]
MTLAEVQSYPIGTPGKPWGQEEKARWLGAQSVQRAYRDEVLERLKAPSSFVLEQYGALSIDPDRFPLFAARSRDWNDGRAVALITGGIHGYETSGVLGALRFLEHHAADYVSSFNVVVAPCASPWGFETINRWNPLAIDPNRAFRAGSASEEASSLMRYVASLPSPVEMHLDLHETTDTDNSEFRPALAARDGISQDVWMIPDGFYLVGDTERPEPGFCKAVIDSVERVTHIAPPDDTGNIIGEPLVQPGVILYAAQPLGLCMGMTRARWVGTTEVYPDSPLVDGENCIDAQVAAVTGALDFVRAVAEG